MERSFIQEKAFQAERKQPSKERLRGIPVASPGFYPQRFLFQLLFSLTLFLCALGCETEKGGEELPPEPLSIPFAVTVRGEPFQCGERYSALGSLGSEVRFGDLRLYIHQVELLDADGQATPLVLEGDGLWQQGDVALLDFEDGCDNGTRELNNHIRGEIVPREYTAVRFRIGLPAALNSPETILEERGSPLNQSSMYWTWNSGYKFMRLDAIGSPFRFHLGASGCSADFECVQENIPVITLEGWREGESKITLDLAQLLEASNLEENSPGSAPGCMGDVNDPDCPPIFQRIGLAEGEPLAFQLQPAQLE